MLRRIQNLTGSHSGDEAQGKVGMLNDVSVVNHAFISEILECDLRTHIDLIGILATCDPRQVTRLWVSVFSFVKLGQ